MLLTVTKKLRRWSASGNTTHTLLPHPLPHLAWRPSCFGQSKHEAGHAPLVRRGGRRTCLRMQNCVKCNKIRTVWCNSRGHATKRGLRVPNPNSRGRTKKRGLRVPNPNSRGHTRKRGLRVLNPNSRGHTKMHGLLVPNPNSRGHATKHRFRVPIPNSRGRTKKRGL